MWEPSKAKTRSGQGFAAFTWLGVSLLSIESVELSIKILILRFNPIEKYREIPIVSSNAFEPQRVGLITEDQERSDISNIGRMEERVNREGAILISLQAPVHRIVPRTMHRFRHHSEAASVHLLVVEVRKNGKEIFAL